MRHQKRGRKLGRSVSHRKAMLSNMAASVLLHKQIKTTEAKAKEVRRLVERLITYGKKGTTHARRLAFAILRDKKATTVLFEEIAPVYETRNGGYTRLIKLGYRPNDTSRVVMLQLVDFFSEEPKKDKKKPTEKKETKKSKSNKTPVADEKVTEVQEAAVEEPPADAPVEEESQAVKEPKEQVSEVEDKTTEEPEAKDTEAADEKAEDDQPEKTAAEKKDK